MLPNGRRLGAHLPLGHGMVKAADRAAEIGASALQVFSDNPTSWRRRPDPAARAAGLPRAPRRARDRAARDPRAVPGQPRRSGPGAAPALRGVPRQRAARGAGVRGALPQRPRRVAPRARARRPGSTGSPTASARPSSCVGADAPDVRLVLENGVRRRVRARLARRGARGDRRRPWRRPASTARGSASASTRRTCGAPATRSTRPAGVDDDARRRSMGCIGLDRLHMVHLNDSRSELGSRADRHEHVGAGRIGGEGLAAHGDAPGARPRHLLPRDAGHGGGLRRGEPRPAPGPGRRPPAGRPCRRRRSTRAARRAGAPRPRTTTPVAAG